MNRSPSLVAILVLLSTAACAGSASEDVSADGAGALSGSSSHTAAVKACASAHEKTSQDAMSTADMIQSEGSWKDCLVKANAAAITKIESILRANESTYAGQAQSAFDHARRTDESICAELDKASPNFGGTLARVEAVSCRAERESFLAALIEGMVAFDGAEPKYLAEDRANHAACYATYDAAAENAMTTADMVSMNDALKQCIHLDAQAFNTPIANIQIENDASFGPFITAQSNIGTDIAAKVSSAGPICRVLSQA